MPYLFHLTSWFKPNESNEHKLIKTVANKMWCVCMMLRNQKKHTCVYYEFMHNKNVVGNCFVVSYTTDSLDLFEPRIKKKYVRHLCQFAKPPKNRRVENKQEQDIRHKNLI